MKNELLLLKEIAEKVKKPTKWDNANFEIIKNLSTTEKGEVGEQFIEILSKQLIDKNAKRNPKSRDSFDIIILNNKIEIKTATEDIGGSFQFNGVRYHRQYDFIFVLGIAPNNIYFNIYSAADIKTGKAGNLVTMEKGTSGSYKLTKKKSELIDFVEFKNILKSNLKQL